MEITEQELVVLLGRAWKTAGYPVDTKVLAKQINALIQEKLRRYTVNGFESRQ